MTTEYRVRLDREACEGVFACLVRDDRFVEASDGLATVEASDSPATVAGGRGGGDGSDVAAGEAAESGELLVSFADERVEDARQAARACPVDAIDVLPEAENE